MIAVFEAMKDTLAASMHFSNSKILCRIAMMPFLLGAVLALVNPVFAQTETVLFSFGVRAGQGITPWASLIVDQKGNFYGTTAQGGAHGLGTVFELSPPTGKHGAWTETVLYSFGSQSGDGANPYDSLIMDQVGNLYGTTHSGGANNDGTVFELSSEPSGTWTESALYSFGAAPNDGLLPFAGLIADEDGNLYGTTHSGGANSDGTVFELSRAPSGTWTETVLYDFAGAPYDGSLPYAGLIMDQAGNLYGTTTEGGAYSFGTVFELSREPSGTWTETVLYSFGSQSEDGANPYGALIMDGQGNLYGTTTGGGAYVYGEVFELSPSAGGSGVWTETALYSFGRYSTDGDYPFDGLIMDNDGDFYGTTTGGGKYSFGTVFEISPAKGSGWTEKELYSFGRRTATGEEPWDSLIMDKDGNLYGTTTEGGATTHCDYGCGTVFRLSPKKGGR
jgi:uncharacterized repeat protein (TIGR03803 family)